MQKGIVTASVFLAALAISSDGRSQDEADYTVDVYHSRFEPADLTIKVGETVRFNNLEAMPEGGHTILIDDTDIASPEIDKDAIWIHTFDKAGSYHIRLQGHDWAPEGFGIEVTAD